MSGYFSRIARQSGARFAGDGMRTGAPVKGRIDPHPSAIEHDETVMLSAAEHLTTPAHESTDKDFDAAGATPSGRRRSGERVAPSVDSTTEKMSSDIAPDIHRTNPAAEEIKLVEADASRHSDTVIEPPAIAPRKVKKHEAANQITTDTSPEATGTHAPVTGAITVQPSEKKFFEKTSELIEGRAAEPDKVHTVLFREVQEWIAAGQTIPDDAVAEAEVFAKAEVAHETLRPHELSTVSERQPGVVRIIDDRRSEKQSDKLKELSTPDSITEQSFELSIGSISVVVEGDDTLPPAPVVVKKQAGIGETPRRTSRLSRHYL